MIDTVAYLLRLLGVRGLAAGVKAKVTGKTVLLEVRRPDLRAPFFLRIPSSDVPVYRQIFLDEAYAFEARRQPKTVIDAGANIGLASIYFSNQFPDSRIIAIEPEESNFELLKRNVAPYENIVPVQGALWSENKPIHVLDRGLGKWCFTTHGNRQADEAPGDVRQPTMGMTVDAIMKEYGIEHIDILKVDIEGAEREVFEAPSSWIGEVDALIIELHRSITPRGYRNFYSATGGFDEEWFQGENLCLTRRSGCLTRRGT